MIRLVRYSAGPLDRALSGLAVLVAIAAVFWVRVGLFELQKASARRGYELMQFERLVDHTRSRPLKDAPDVAAHVNRELQAQKWHTNLPGVRPEVVLDRQGPRIQFIPTHRPRAVVESR